MHTFRVLTKSCWSWFEQGDEILLTVIALHACFSCMHECWLRKWDRDLPLKVGTLTVPLSCVYFWV
jgi:hypothetical protein